MKTTSDIPTGAKESLATVLLVSQHNVGKEMKNYTGWVESGLLGSFGFEGVCTAGDGSCDVPSRSMGTGFCNFKDMKWDTTAPLPYVTLQVHRTLESSKVDREEEGLISNRPEPVGL